jgi:hypothetical protein
MARKAALRMLIASISDTLAQPMPIWATCSSSAKSASRRAWPERLGRSDLRDALRMRE